MLHQVTIRIPKDLWLKFRSAVVLENKTVREVIEQMMTDFIAKQRSDSIEN